MRKMMLVAVAVLTAAVTQATSVGWSLAGAGNFANDAYQFFIIGQNGATSIKAITDLLDAGSDTSAKAFGSGKVASNGAATVLAKDSGVSLNAAGTYEGFFVIFDTTSPSTATKYALVSGVNTLKKTIAAETANVTFAAGSAADFLNNASNWKATPEPASVALLLLGAAAFGLRRKRA